MFYQSVIRENPAIFKDQILQFLDFFDDAVFLDSHSGSPGQIPLTGTRYDYIAAAGVTAEITGDHNGIESLRQFIQGNQQKGNWIFGFVSYDMKNHLESLTSNNPVLIEFPLFHFFVASHVLIAEKGEIKIISKDDPSLLWKKIAGTTVTATDQGIPHDIHISHIPDRETYLNAVNRLLYHIQQGDIYEVNYC